ncbi:NACHT domain-containing protein [Nonomuraea gerenzanensis]|uniref:NACHT domain-containing protein n=1 Tax=Nonomuraea gerenzanensis TaxID=93944 RepID=A0A1M4E9D2_9ACTN|nr:NACHT domain-containing protein [Nonomuraea gerenzanensis]UBU17581.1 NACHT domain-containing protein [Nonomuraea gerenzanensis]SBO95344.1 hypothetical protein BN4615_P4860 [Nonomuraea gerenzanensis]
MPLDAQLLEVPEGLLAIVGGIAGVLTLIFEVALFTRQEHALFRRVTGGIELVAGLAMVAGGVAWQLTLGLPPRWDHWPAYLALAGVAFVVRGFVRVRTAGVGRAADDVHALAGRIEEEVWLFPPDRLTPDSYVPLDLRRPPYGRYPRPRDREAVAELTRWLRSTRKKPCVLYGESGSGKSVVLRRLARDLAARAQRRRRPSLMAVYVDLEAMPPRQEGDQRSDEELLRDHIRTQVGGHDPEMLRRLDRIFSGGYDSVVWAFLFDGFDDFVSAAQSATKEDTAQRWLQAVKRLKDGSETFRVVVASRDRLVARHLGWPVLALSPLTLARQVAFARELGQEGVGGLLKSMNADDELRPVVTLPLLLNLLLLHLRDEGGADGELRRDALVEAAVLQRLGHLDSARREAALRAGQDAAYPYPPAAVTVPGPDAPLNELVKANIARWRNDRLECVSKILEDYFVTGWIIRAGRVTDARRLFQDGRHLGALTAVLRRAGDDPVDPLRRDVISAATTLLQEVVETAGPIEDYRAHLSREPREPFPPRERTFAWPPVALGVFHVILDSGIALHDTELRPIREAAARMVVAAFASGAGLDQRYALALLPLLDVDVALWAVLRSGAADSAVRGGPYELLAIGAKVYERLTIPQRLVALAKAMRTGRLVERALTGRRRPGIAAVIRSVIRTLQLFGVALFLVFLLQVVELAITGDPVAALVEFVVVLLPVAWFLLSSVGLLGRPPIFSTFLLAFLAAVFAAGGLWRAAVALASLDPVTILGGLVGVAFVTWPFARVIDVIMFPEQRAWHDVVLPQIRVLREAHTRLVRQGLRQRYEQLQLLIRAGRPLKGTFPLFVFLIFAGVSLLDLPGVEGEAETEQKLPILGWVLGAACAVRYGSAALRVLAERRDMRRHLSRGAFDRDEVLAHLHRLTSHERTARFLKNLCACPPEQLSGVVSVLVDLDRTFDQVIRLVPAGTTRRVPPAVWEVGLDFDTPGFRAWLVSYDAAHPGRLSWMVSDPGRIFPVSACLRRLGVNRVAIPRD